MGHSEVTWLKVDPLLLYPSSIKIKFFCLHASAYTFAPYLHCAIFSLFSFIVGSWSGPLAVLGYVCLKSLRESVLVYMLFPSFLSREKRGLNPINKKFSEFWQNSQNSDNLKRFSKWVPIKIFWENFQISVQPAAPKYFVQKFLKFSEKIGGFKILRFFSKNFSELRFLLIGLSPLNFELWTMNFYIRKWWKIRCEVILLRNEMRGWNYWIHFLPNSVYLRLTHNVKWVLTNCIPWGIISRPFSR